MEININLNLRGIILMLHKGKKNVIRYEDNFLEKYQLYVKKIHIHQLMTSIKANI